MVLRILSVGIILNSRKSTLMMLSDVSETSNKLLYLRLWQEEKVLPRFELGSLDSKSKVLTITP